MPTPQFRRTPGRARVLLAYACASVLLLALLGAAASPADAASRLPSERHWHRDVVHAMEGSHKYLRHAIAAGGATYAINLDIDNTSLATHYQPGRAVRPVRAFVRYAAARGVAVLFNTGRFGAKVTAAVRMLKRAGYHPTEVCGRRSAGETLRHSKPRCRARFIDEGYTIIANVGNNTTDFSGPKDYGRAFELPNYGGRLG